VELSGVDLFLLEVLIEGQRPERPPKKRLATLYDLQKEVGLSSGTAVRSLRRLEREARVVSRSDPGSRRKAEYKVKPEAEELVKQSVARQQRERETGLRRGWEFRGKRVGEAVVREAWRASQVEIGLAVDLLMSAAEERRGRVEGESLVSSAPEDPLDRLVWMRAIFERHKIAAEGAAFREIAEALQAGKRKVREVNEIE
jgi:DNA-binding MarR family transcriptional regulator